MALAEDRAYYTLRFVRPLEDGGYEVMDDGVDLVRTSHFLGETIPKPPQAMAWSGYRTGIQGIHKALVDDPSVILDADSPEAIEAVLKERRATPRDSLRAAGDRGNAAHKVGEELCKGNREKAEALSLQETLEYGTRYGAAIILEWDERVQPYIDSGEILEVISEKRVTYLGHGRNLGWVGTFDRGLLWTQGSWPDGTSRLAGWEIDDYKTHKPAKGFTLPGKGPAYISDVAQIKAYRMGFEDCEYGWTIGQRVIVARENGSYLEDRREATADYVLGKRQDYNEQVAFEKGVS